MLVHFQSLISVLGHNIDANIISAMSISFDTLRNCISSTKMSPRHLGYFRRIVQIVFYNCLSAACYGNLRYFCIRNDFGGDSVANFVDLMRFDNRKILRTNFFCICSGRIPSRALPH